MTKQFDNVNRGALFNDAANKRDDNGRDYSGTINIEGIDYWLAGWIKISKKGQKYLALAAKMKEAKSDTDDDVGF